VEDRCCQTCPKTLLSYRPKWLYRPISVTPISSSVLERIVIRDFIYPALQHPPTQLDFTDQFAFQPLSSTTAALTALLQTITTMLTTNKYVIVYCLDFSKAFVSVKHSTLFNKYANLDLPDYIGSSRFSIIAHIAHSMASSCQTYFQLLPVLSRALPLVQSHTLLRPLISNPSAVPMLLSSMLMIHTWLSWPPVILLVSLKSRILSLGG